MEACVFELQHFSKDITKNVCLVRLSRWQGAVDTQALFLDLFQDFLSSNFR